MKMITKYKLFEEWNNLYPKDSIWVSIEKNDINTFKEKLNDKNINDVNAWNRNVLRYCIDYLRIDMIKYISEKFYKTAIIQPDTLLSIVNYNNLNIIMIIYKIIRKDKNIKFFEDLSLLHLASHKANFWLIKQLLRDDVDITITSNGKTFVDFLDKLYIAYNYKIDELKKEFPDAFKKAMKLKQIKKFKI